nr:hypothetical protein [Tanacetum cinerariifolium]
KLVLVGDDRIPLNPLNIDGQTTIMEPFPCLPDMLYDAEGVVCLPNEEIFSGLAQMGYEKPTSWNEFSTAMASAVICLSKGQKFNFLKYIFDSLVRNVDISSKFYMVGKGFSGVETLLFKGMLVARQPAEEGLVDKQVEVDDVVAAAVEENVTEDVAHDAIPSPPSHDIPSPSQEPSSPPQQPQSSPQAPPQGAEVGASQQVESFDDMEDVFNQGRMIDDMDKDEGIELVKDADIAESEGRHTAQQAKNQAEIYHIDLDHSSKVLISAASATIPAAKPSIPAAAPTVVAVYTRRRKGVIIRDPEEELYSKTPVETPKLKDKGKVIAASATIPAAKPSIPAAAPTVVVVYTRRRKGVIIRDPEEELYSKTPVETPKLKDKGKGILVETPKPMKKKDQIELDTEYVRKFQEEINRDEFNKDIDWDAAMDHKAAKRRKLSEEAQEAEDLRKRLEVVDDEDDDVFIKATPLTRKVPVVDYQIVLIDNKPRFKIIKADETHQLNISFTTLLKNFDREDQENL